MLIDIRGGASSVDRGRKEVRDREIVVLSVEFTKGHCIHPYKSHTYTNTHRRMVLPTNQIRLKMLKRDKRHVFFWNDATFTTKITNERSTETSKIYVYTVYLAT